MIMITRQLTITVALLASLCFCHTAAAQSLSVAEILQQEKEWDKWVRDKKHVHIDGRYAGRFARQFRLEKLPFMMQPGRNTVLPAGLDGGQRMTVSGYLEKNGSRFLLNVDRLAVGSADAERIRDRIRRLPESKPEAAFGLADEYEPNAVFYEDDELAAEIAKIRSDAFDLQRQLVKDDAVALQKLLVRGNQLGVPKRTLDAILFQSIVVMTRQQPPPDSDAVARGLKKLTDWDKPSPFLDRKAEADFLADPIAKYEQADDPMRMRMNRRFYRSIRLPQILQAKQADGSNGREVAKTIREELPEELQAAKDLDNAYIEFQLGRIKTLTRRQLQDLDKLLKQFGRQEEMAAAVEKWLKFQEQRLTNGQLDGTIAVADEYLFAYDVWKNSEHKSIGCTNLKKAFIATRTAAPQVAAEIETRLKDLGWLWLHERWMSAAEADSLPDNDTAKAMTESLVVNGMSAAKVVELLGQPSRKIRVVSSQGVHAIWVFGDVRTTQTVVHLSRTRFQSPQEAVATYVGVDRR